MNSGSSTENLGNTSSPNTCPILSFSAWLVMTEPPFISLPVPTMVSTHPTGMSLQVGSSKRMKYFCQGSSPQYAETDTAFA